VGVVLLPYGIVVLHVLHVVQCMHGWFTAMALQRHLGGMDAFVTVTAVRVCSLTAYCRT
jgi:hypothetical protein